MAQKESNAYILGTDFEELHRLGIQHQVWATEAHTGWESAGFKGGDRILDLGSGPGFCSREIAYLVGQTGSVFAIDKSAIYIDHLRHTAEMECLNIESILSDFDDLDLLSASLDGMYCRWALAWVNNPEEILAQVLSALKPGGRMVIHEYFDWSTHQTEPNLPGLTKAIQMAYKSFLEQPGDINIGRRLPKILSNLGMHNIKIRPMNKLVSPTSASWQWPVSFYRVYFPKLVHMSLLTRMELEQALSDLEELETNPLATIFCPSMVEVIAQKEA